MRLKHNDGSLKSAPASCLIQLTQSDLHLRCTPLRNSRNRRFAASNRFPQHCPAMHSPQKLPQFCVARERCTTGMAASLLFCVSFAHRGQPNPPSILFFLLEANFNVTKRTFPPRDLVIWYVSKPQDEQNYVMVPLPRPPPGCYDPALGFPTV